MNSCWNLIGQQLNLPMGSWRPAQVCNRSSSRQRQPAWTRTRKCKVHCATLTTMVSRFDRNKTNTHTDDPEQPGVQLAG